MLFQVRRHVILEPAGGQGKKRNRAALANEGETVHTVFIISARDLSHAWGRTIEFVPRSDCYLKCTFDVDPIDEPAAAASLLAKKSAAVRAAKAIDVNMLANRLKTALVEHPRLDKPYHARHIAALVVAKDLDSATGLQCEEDNGHTLLYALTQPPCQDASGLVRKLPDVQNLRVCVCRNPDELYEIDVVAKVNVALHSLDGSDGSEEIEVVFPVWSADDVQHP